MSENGAHGQEDPTSDPFRRMDQFIEQQSEARFDFDHHLEVSFALYKRLSPESGATGPDTDKKRRHVTLDSVNDQNEERRTIIEKMWGRLHQLKQSDGVSALYDLKSRLEIHQEEEEEKLHTANTKGTAVGLYQDVLEKKRGEPGSTQTMSDVFPPSSFGEEQSGPVEPRCHITWRLDPREEFGGKENNITGSGKIETRQILDDPDFSYPLQFAANDTLKELWSSLRKMGAKVGKEREKQGIICRVVDLRKTLLDRFLWTFEIAGRVPEEVTVSDVSEKLRNNKEAFRHACVLLELRPYLSNSCPPTSTPPTKGEVEDCISDRIDLSELGCIEPQAVVNGAVRLLKKVLSDRDNSAVDEEFWRLLDRHKVTLRSEAEKIELDIPVPIE